MPKRKKEKEDLDEKKKGKDEKELFQSLRNMVRLTKKDFYLPNRVIMCKIGRLSDPNWKINLVHTSHITNGKFSIIIFPASVSRCRRSKVTLSLFSSAKLIGTALVLSNRLQCVKFIVDSKDFREVADYICTVTPPYRIVAIRLKDDAIWMYEHVNDGRCATKEHGIYAAYILLYTLSEKLGIDDLYLVDFSTPNIVGSVQLGHWIDLELLRLTHVIEYTTKNVPVKDALFPGMVLHMNEEMFPKEECVSYIVFNNGKINVTGMSTDKKEVLDKIIHRANTMFEPFRMD